MHKYSKSYLQTCMLGYIQDHTSIALCFITLHCLALHACLHAHRETPADLPTDSYCTCLPPAQLHACRRQKQHRHSLTYRPALLPTFLSYAYPPACLPAYLHYIGRLHFPQIFMQRFQAFTVTRDEYVESRPPTRSFATNGVTRPERPKRSEDSLLRHSVTAPGCPWQLGSPHPVAGSLSERMP